MPFPNRDYAMPGQINRFQSTCDTPVYVKVMLVCEETPTRAHSNIEDYQNEQSLVKREMYT